MATRSRIGYELPDHSVVSVYCHWDGYPKHNGKILVKHYQNREDVKELIDGGGISSLRTRGTWESGAMLRDENGEYICDEEGDFMHFMYENDRDPQPLYYTERGEELEVMHSSFDEFLSSNSWEEYAYLYDLNGQWKAYEIGWKEEPTKEVEIPDYQTVA